MRAGNRAGDRSEICMKLTLVSVRKGKQRISVFVPADRLPENKTVISRKLYAEILKGLRLRAGDSYGA